MNNKQYIYLNNIINNNNNNYIYYDKLYIGKV